MKKHKHNWIFFTAWTCQKCDAISFSNPWWNESIWKNIPKKLKKSQSTEDLDRMRELFNSCKSIKEEK